MTSLGVLAGLSFLTFLSTSALASTCGAEGQRPCNGSDNINNVIYSSDWLKSYTGEACDRGLIPTVDFATFAAICTGLHGNGGRYQFPTSSLSPWTKFILKDKSFGTQVDLPMNWTSTFGTHDSFSNFVDGSYSYIDGDQKFSISDQLIAGARTIRMDPITYATIGYNPDNFGAQNSALRMCHQSDAGGGTPVCNFDSYGRLFEYGMEEVKHWLDANPGEVITIRMYRVQSSDVAEITNTIAGTLDPATILLPPCTLHQAPGCYQPYASAGSWDPDVNGWPTLRQMRSMGKRVIFFSDTSTPVSFTWTDWFLDDAYTDDPNPNHFNPNNCANTAGVDVRKRAFNQWSYIGEDRSLSNTFSSAPGAGLIGPDDAKTAAFCNFSITAVDFFYAGGDATDISLTLPSYIPYLNGKTLAAHYRFADPDTRYVNSVWNWQHSADGSSGDSGDSGPAYIDGHGVWMSRNPNSWGAYACAMNGGTVQSPIVTHWSIPVQQGFWDKGFSACQAIGGRFSAPQNAIENNALTIAFTQYINTTGGALYAWLNYSKTPTVNITPTFCPPTADGSCPFGATINKGAPPAAGFSMSYMGGTGGHLTYAANVLGGQPSILAADGTVDYNARTMHFNWAPGVASLAPGVYQENVNVFETNPQTFLPSQQMLTFTLTVLDTPVSVAVVSNPSGEMFSVDEAQVVASPHTFAWHLGENHTLRAITPTNPSTGVQRSLTNWSTGETAPSINILVGTANTKYTANFADAFALTLATSGSGTLTATPLPPASGYYALNTHLTLTATPDSGFSFTGYTGSIGANSTNPLTLSINGPASITANFTANAIPITLAANPSNLSLIADGVSFQGSKTFSWTPGSKHQIDASQPAGGAAQVQFLNWSDGGGTSHSYTVPSSAATVTANFLEKFQLVLNVLPGGVVNLSPPSPDGFYPLNQQVVLTAVPNSGYTFGNYNGAISGSTNPQTITVQHLTNVTANFVKNVTVTFGSNWPGVPSVIVDGATLLASTQQSWVPGSTHTIGIANLVSGGTNQRYSFSSWLGLGTVTTYTVAPTADMVYVANYGTQFLVSATTAPTGAGTVTGAGWYNAGDSAVLTALASGGQVFTGFTGISSTVSPATVNVNGPIVAVANFAPAPATVNATLTVIADTDPSQVTLQAGFRNLGKGTAGGLVVDSATIVTSSGQNDVTTTVPILVGDIQGNTTVNVPIVLTWPTAETKITLTLHYIANGGVLQNTQKFNLFR